MNDVLKRIGVIGAEPTTSHIYVQWAPLMNPPADSPRKTGMIITHVWDKDRTVAEQFARAFGEPKVVDRFDQMVGHVDGVIQSGYMASFWSLELVRPYLEAGIPVFIDRPGAYSLVRVRQLSELAAKNNSPLIVSNNHENNRAVDLLKARSAALGPLTSLLADSLSDNDVRIFSMHCIHGWYMLFPLLSGKVRRVRTYLADPAHPSPVSIMECENDDRTLFNAVLMRHRNLHRGYVKLFGREGAYDGTVLPPAHHRIKRKTGPQEVANYTAQNLDYLLTDFSLPPMISFERMIRTRRMPQTYEQIVEKVQVFLAMHKSLLEGGTVVPIASLDPQWTSPNPYPDYFPPGFFDRGRGAA